MTLASSSTPSRLARVGVAVTMAVALLVAVPPPADAHESGCAPGGADTGFQLVAAAVNVFSALFSSSAMDQCTDQFADVEVVRERDYVADRAPAEARVGAAARANAPESFARCRNGMAADTFPCDNVNMLGHVTMEELRSTFVNDMWGWNDPATRKDYALVGQTEGTSFVDISDPFRPEVLGILPTASTQGGAVWRDVKVYDDHAFVVSEHTDHGVQVFDLTRLRDWDGEYTTYDADARYTGIGSSHNIGINVDTGYAYVVGAANGAPFDSDTPPAECGNGIHMIDIAEPTSPTFAGCFQAHSYVHDIQCVVYDGPDTEHQGQEICVNSNGINYDTSSSSNFLSVVDVTDKSNPVPLAQVPYEGSGYSHQGWLSEDHEYFFHGDEGDEILTGVATTTRTWDLSDLDDPVVADVLVNDTASIDHNLYTVGDIMYQANYTTGLRVQDVSDPASGPVELAYFDVYPDNDNASFEGGAWSNYPYLRRPGLVAVSSIDRGLFILQVQPGALNGRRGR